MVYSDEPDRGADDGAGRLATQAAGAASQVESVECSPHPPPTGHGLTSNTSSSRWTTFQENFMDSWPEHLAQHSYDAFWMENEPVFHPYNYGANIEIEVSEGLQSLERETRLRPREDSDDDADANAGDDEGSAAGGDETGHGARPEKSAVCLLADRNMVQREYGSSRSTSGMAFYLLAFHPAYGNFTSPGPPRFLQDHVLAVMKVPERRGGRVVVRPLPRAIVTAALTLPESAAKGSARVRALQQRFLRRMQGSTTPDDPDASRPFARERQRIQHTRWQNA
ncbi:hypothetical protein VE03_10101, partial [Pseudogymnoascus sp. 23342-1-I1]